MIMASKKPTTLWIGGSSNLTRTYINLLGHDELVLAGLEERAPAWIPKDATFLSLDLTKTEFDPLIFQNITSLIIGIQSLILEDQNEILLVGLKAFLDKAAKEGVQYLVHISSLTKVDNLINQRNKTNDGKSLGLVEGPYDEFARQSEELINQYRCFESVHLRIAGIFCDSPSCFHSKLLALQSRIGPSSSMPVLVEFNSGRNTALAIKMLLENLQQENHVADEYFYTRPLHNKVPAKYGEYLEQYRKAYDITIFLPITFALFRMLSSLLQQLKIRDGFVLAVDYIVQASKHDQIFDCSRFARDFPSIVDREETIYECFRRRRHSKNSK